MDSHLFVEKSQYMSVPQVGIVVVVVVPASGMQVIVRASQYVPVAQVVEVVGVEGAGAYMDKHMFIP
jgi:hypothetical protein